MGRETRIRTYKNPKAYEKDLQKMARHGWRQLSSTVTQPRSGIMRFIMLGGIGALVFKRKERITVTYEREAATATPR